MEEKTIQQFCDNEYISFASYDVYRKIANVVDGLKVSARKVLYTCIEDNKQDKPKKVEALSNRAAEFTDYHHGSNSLVGVIVGLAQRYVGSNNIPLLKADGQFGNRIIPEAAAPRYIFTCKEPYVNKLFNVEDVAVLEQQYSDDQKIEPKFYVPILPMILVNGSVGLSVGFAQNILPRNPADLIKYINRKLIGQNCNNELLPYWKGFKGKVVQREQGVFDIYGHVRLENKTIIIDELPIGMEYLKYVSILDKLVEDKKIIKYVDKCDTKTDVILFEVKISPQIYQEFLSNPVQIIEFLKLRISETENYTCIDPTGKVKVYSSVFEIIDEYIKVRLEYYNKRKIYNTTRYANELNVIVSRCLFIKAVINGDIILKHKTLEEINNQISQITRIVKIDNSYEYLLKMPIWSITSEKYTELCNKAKEKKQYLDSYKILKLEDMWKQEIQELDFE